MNTKQVCKKFNISSKALRIYEDYQLLVPKREENNYRSYSQEDLLKLREIILLRELGFSLKEVKLLIEKNNFQSNQLVRSLYFQMKAIESKYSELAHIKETLKDGINAILPIEHKCNSDFLLDNISKSLEENRDRRRQWIDKWGFDQRAWEYDKRIRDKTGDQLGLMEGYDDILGDIRRRILAYEPKTILEIGCGTGNLCGELSHTLEVIGVDQSLEMLLQARKKYAAMKVRLGNFLDKPFCKNRFDVVVSSYAMHTLRPMEKEQAITNMLEYLKENGTIIIGDFMFFNKEEEEKCKENLLNSGRQDLWDFIDNRYYTRIEEMESYATALGCKVSYQHMVNFTWIIEIRKN